MQASDAIFHVDMHHHGGVLPVRAGGHVGVPAGLHQPHERIESTGQRRPVRCAPLVVVAFPLGDQRILMGLQGGIEFRRLELGQGDPERGGLPVAGFGDRPPPFGLRIRLRSRFELDRGAQLGDGGDLGQRRIMLIRTVGCPLGDHTDLIQRQPALPQALNAAGKLR